MTTTTKTRSRKAGPGVRPARPVPGRGRRRGRPSAVMVGAAGVGFLALAAIVIGAVTDGSDLVPEGTAQVRAVEVSGPALSPAEGGATDPPQGQAAPVVTGSTFTGEPVSFGGAGEPQLVFFLAHWCPHCRNEVPVITDWLEDNGTPEGVRLVAVSTTVSSSRPNFPPLSWLEREDWPVETMADDSDSTAYQAYGQGGLPYFVAIEAEGRVVARGSGELETSGLEALVAAARHGVPGPVTGE